MQQRNQENKATISATMAGMYKEEEMAEGCRQK